MFNTCFCLDFSFPCVSFVSDSADHRDDASVLCACSRSLSEAGFQAHMRNIVKRNIEFQSIPHSGHIVVT